MHKVKLLSTVAAAALLFGIAGASAATSDAPPAGLQLAQSSGSGAGSGSGGGTGSGAGNGGASDTGPQSDTNEPQPGASPELTPGMSSGDAETPEPTGTGTATGTGTEPGAETGTEPGATMGETGETTPMTEQELATRSDEIIGQQVVNQQGEEIGEINDLVVDENSQPYAVVGVGGFLGMGEREVAVPVSNLDIGSDQIVYNGIGSVDEFKTMPEYEEGTWRSMKQ